MSCQIKGVGYLVDASRVKEILFENALSRFEHVPCHELPLQDCLVSLSSAGDVLVMAWNTKMIILVSKWDSQEPSEVKNKFHIAWNGIITEEQNEWVTAVLCLPLLSLGKVTAGSGPDWTCIAVGFNTGVLRFYTETGALLLVQQLHNEPILGLKCQSYSLYRHANDKKSMEEIHVIYSSIICILQGFQLFSTLRAYRNHLARVQAKCNDVSPITNLIYKKWGFRNQDVINDVEVIGTTSVNSFDHLMTISICGGYNASYRSSAPQNNLVIATGKRPFIGFHYTIEGGSGPVLSDVAIAVASKLANAIGTAVPWFRGNSKIPLLNEISKGAVTDPAEIMSCRFTLSDIMREGDCIVSSPNKRLSVVSDIMGRVTLVDNRRGVAIRMWKGYRDAQCGWIEATEERYRGMHKNQSKSMQTSHMRSALFLVIYAPRKGVIDIWGIQHGPKITTFTASKNGRLLYINYGLLGISDHTALKKNSAQYSCIFMDPLGGLKEIIVPFHFALSSKNGKKARDIHLLRKLRTFLREEEFDDEKLITEVRNICADIQTSDVKVQTMEMLMIDKNITSNALLAAANYFIEALDRCETKMLEPAAKMLYLLVNHLRQIITFYKDISSRSATCPKKNIVSDNEIPNAKVLAAALLTSEREIHRVLKLFKTICNFQSENITSKTKVKFEIEKRVFLDFLSCFELGTTGSIGLQKDIKLERKIQISMLIFEDLLHSSNSIVIWKKVAMDSNIKPFVLMEFALIYWMHRNECEHLEVELKLFTQLLYAICSLNSIEEISAEYNEFSEWWKNVCTILTESTKPFNAFTAALACRAVVMTFEKYKEKMYNVKEQDNNGNEEDDQNNGNDLSMVEDRNEKQINLLPEDEVHNSIGEWENVSKDTCQFTLLIGNLEDVTILDIIVRQHPPMDHTTDFFALPFEACDISLGLLLSKGKGAVSEIVAKWLSSTGIHPAQLIDTTDVEFEQIQLTMDPLVVSDSLDEASAMDMSEQNKTALLSLSVEIGQEMRTDSTAQSWVLEKISLLKRHFPYSLTSSVLLANLCWEYTMSWNRNVSQLEALNALLNVLRLIPMKHMRHGVCCLLWTLHIKKRMESAAKLMNKLGKLPKERLCMQDIGISDIQLITFLQYCVTFFEIFIDVELLEAMTNKVIKSEELWEGHASAPQPFAALAISQIPAWYDLILLHLQVANVLHMMAQFNLKVSKPLNNLFESVVHPYLFQDMTDKAVFTWYQDDKRDALRTEFLFRVITASMEFIHQETTDGKTLSSMQAVVWMSRCQTLASMWKINNDELRIHQVCQLYINGFDRLADEIVPAVNDIERLGINLLPIAGRRMIAYLSKAPDLLEEVSRISTTLIKYLESLNLPELIFTNCRNNDTVELIKKILRCLPETHSNYHLAQLMLDATFIYEDDDFIYKENK